jgi:hypothetical protein
VDACTHPRELQAQLDHGEGWEAAAGQTANGPVVIDVAEMVCVAVFRLEYAAADVLFHGLTEVLL